MLPTSQYSASSFCVSRCITSDAVEGYGGERFVSGRSIGEEGLGPREESGQEGSLGACDLGPADALVKALDRAEKAESGS